ncbi:hypothetical protein DKX38_022230 [Salix brachista]|uniref:Uncharacterized protein n=1 Tax=Salix brachista TaxID=2182728 RepID=A0A5N5JZ32_9ROSI|nr:hypothetical protein DKX38_022162 [Salix brachista]KAB5524481.1 hypothetical protein DKX38_022230 [Salix brachista]
MLLTFNLVSCRMLNTMSLRKTPIQGHYHPLIHQIQYPMGLAFVLLTREFVAPTVSQQHKRFIRIARLSHASNLILLLKQLKNGLWTEQFYQLRIH